jgi:hypothetical protein
MLRLVRRLAHSPVRVGARCCLDPRYTSPQTASRTRTSPAAASRSEAGSRPSPSSPRDAARSILPPSVRLRLRHPTSSTCSRCCARAERSSFTAAAAGTARARSRRSSNSYLPERSSGCSWHRGDRASVPALSNRRVAESLANRRGERRKNQSPSLHRGHKQSSPGTQAIRKEPKTEERVAVQPN